MSQKCQLQGIYTESNKSFIFPLTTIIIEESGCFSYKSDGISIEGSINSAQNTFNFVYTKNGKKLINEGTMSDNALKGKWAYDTKSNGVFELLLEGYKPVKKGKLSIEPISYGKKVGFFLKDGEKKDMDLELGLLDDGTFFGKGKDYIGEFEMTGGFSQYDSNEVNITKQYIGKHIEIYNGVFDNKVIKGIWVTEEDIGEEFEIAMSAETTE
jgi:hypothetical protein